MNNPYESPRTKSAAEPSRAAPDYDRVLYEIKREATNSVVCGVLGFVFVIFAPAAIYFGRRTRKLIEKHDHGHEHQKRAKRGMQLGWFVLTLWGVLFLCAIAMGFLAVLLPSEV